MTPAETDAVARRINHHNAQRTTRAESAAHAVLFVVFVILGTLALVHYATPCEVGLCLLPAAAKLPDGEPNYWKRAWQAGYNTAEKACYTAGWRTGVGHGLLAGLLLGMLAMFALVQLGQLVGG